MDVKKAAHDLAMLYVERKIGNSSPPIELLTSEYIKAYEAASNKLDERIADYVGEAPPWPE